MRILTLTSIGLVVSMVTSCSSEGDGASTDDTTDAGVTTQEADANAAQSTVLGVEVVGAGVVSTEANETFPAQDPIDGSLWYSVYENSFDAQTIMRAERTQSGWGDPQVASFSGSFGDRAPRFSPDGQFIYFTSNRPGRAGSSDGDMNIWRTPRTATGWGEPQLLGDPLNSDGRDIHVSISNSGAWVASNRDGGLGRSDIYRVALAGVSLGELTHAAAPINDEHSQPDIWVSPDETWMILVITDHPTGLGGDDLFLSRFEDNAWTTPRNLGPNVNSDEYEYGPTISQNGEFIYFTSHRSGSADTYRVPVASILSQSS